jgi:protocatechuate 3,4-dioxygenase beta subunit
MKWFETLQGRRRFLQSIILSAAAFSTRGAFAQQLVETAPLTEGPFYPDQMPLDTDNDLLIINDAITPAVGEITHLTGKVLSASGEPVRNAFVEIWQADGKSSYHHSQGRSPKGYDPNFQGYGRFLTDSKGRYYFRTIKPVPYSIGDVFRTPHIHVAISRNGRRVFTTQLFIRGHKDNARDFLFNKIGEPRARETVLVDFKPVQESRIGELTANFDIIPGSTLNQFEQAEGWGIGKPQRSTDRGGE